ncbi:MAG: hypothetical protein HQL67_08050 [Magnetococcales bacterium]|nr:hypothetical protein [Magnetococcales bacterium]
MLPLLIPITLSAALGAFLGNKAARQLSKAGDGQFFLAGLDTPPSFKIVRESLIKDEPLVLAEEEIPLDNLHGSSVLNSEHEFIRTATISMEVDRGREVGTALNASFWKAFQARASGELSNSLGLKIGSQLTRRVRLRFSVSPQKMVRYRILWKQTSRRGEFEVVMGGKRRYTIPYMVTYGLSHSVVSLSGQESPAPEVLVSGESITDENSE